MQIYCQSEDNYIKAKGIAEKYNLVAVSADIEPLPDELYLSYNDDGLRLCHGELSLLADFRDSLRRIKQSNLEREMLVKVSKVKDYGATPTLIDATAGLGEDSIILAAAGFNIVMYECNPVIAALLEDAIERAKEVEELSGIVKRMTVKCENSIDAMKRMGKASGTDVVLLDPMFPTREKSGLIKKKFQLLQMLERPCSEERELLEAAMSVCPRRIIIKRPAKGPYLAGEKPDYSIDGKAIRYDCIVNVKNKLQVSD